MLEQAQRQQVNKTPPDTCHKSYHAHTSVLQPQASQVDETHICLSDQESQERAQQLQRTMPLLAHASKLRGHQLQQQLLWLLSLLGCPSRPSVLRY